VGKTRHLPLNEAARAREGEPGGVFPGTKTIFVPFANMKINRKLTQKVG